MIDAVFSPALFATSFTTVLVIQDPLGAVPVFLSLTSRQTPAERRRSARQATLVSFSVILAFAIFGRYILKFLGISVPALQVSGACFCCSWPSSCSLTGPTRVPTRRR